MYVCVQMCQNDVLCSLTLKLLWELSFNAFRENDGCLTPIMGIHAYFSQCLAIRTNTNAVIWLYDCFWSQIMPNFICTLVVKSDCIPNCDSRYICCSYFNRLLPSIVYPLVYSSNLGGLAKNHWKEWWVSPEGSYCIPLVTDIWFLRNASIPLDISLSFPYSLSVEHVNGQPPLSPILIYLFALSTREQGEKWGIGDVYSNYLQGKLSPASHPRRIAVVDTVLVVGDAPCR